MSKQIPKNLSPKQLYEWLFAGSQKPLLVDVREDDELAIAPFPAPVIHLPLSKAHLWMKDLPKNLNTTKQVVVMCHSGIRSWNFSNWLIEQGWDYEVWNLDGGIDAWSVNVDPKVPRY